MKVMEQLSKMLSVLEDKRAIPALLTWPKFSFESFLVISRLARQGVCPKTFLDIGANVGQFAVAAAKLFPDATVYSFEPDPETIQKLRKNVSAIGRIKVRELALGDAPGEVTFNVNKNTQVSSILPLHAGRLEAFPDATVRKTIKVQVDTLDRVFCNVEMASPILLKIDVQGYEDRVLKGAPDLLQRIDYILFEASLKPLYEGERTFVEMIKLMEEFGYSFLRPLNYHLSPLNGEVIEMDVLFRRNS
jgi:FkbM family methyltransferase